METIIHTSSKSYPLIVEKGAIGKLWPFIQKMKPHVTKIMLITDDQVGPLHLNGVVTALKQDLIIHIVPHGEKEKNMLNYERCLTTAIESGLDRHSLILALGGGMIGDLAGFVAASFMRGIRFIQLPTTLLAHDSAVGGKVAINHPLGKNMIGAFHQPEGVIYDLCLLQTLSEKEWRSGFAELLKHSYIDGPDFVEWIQKYMPTMDDVKSEYLEEALIKGISVKAKIVKEDEKEKGVRAYLNFGHTLGHALENLLGYGGITHGDAVAIGMRFAFLVSEWYYKKSFNRTAILQQMDHYGYPRMVNLPVPTLIQSMKKDKKSMNSHVRMVLISKFGELQIEEVSDYILNECLQQFIQEELAN